MSNSETATETTGASRVQPEPDRRLGRFSISRCCLAHWRDLSETVMKGTVVVQADFDYAADCVRFTGFNEAFEHCHPGVMPPEYVCRITRKEGEDGQPPSYEVKWDRVPSGMSAGMFELLASCDERD